MTYPVRGIFAKLLRPATIWNWMDQHPCIRQACLYTGLATSLSFTTNTYAGFQLMLEDKINVHGDSASPVESQRLWKVLVDINNKIRKTNSSDRKVETIHNLLYDECNLENPNKYLVESRQIEAKERSEDYGLSIRGHVSREANTQGDDDSTSSYVELSWDALKNGYVENRRRSKVLSNEANLIKIRGEIEQQQNIIECYDHHLANIFSGFKTRLLSQKLTLLSSVYDIERRAYFKGWSFLEDYLEVEAELRKTVSTLNFLNAPEFLDPYINEINDLPILGLNIEALTDAMREDMRLHEITTLKKDIINESKRNYPESSLRLYLRHEVDIGNSSAEASDLVTGLRFIVPLGRSNNGSVNRQLKHIEAEAGHDTWERLNLVRSIYSDTTDLIEEIIDLEYEYIKSIEKTRRSLVEREIVNNADVGLAVVRTLQSIDTRMLYLRKKTLLYKKINEAFQVANRNYNPEYLLSVNLPDSEYRARDGERYVYLYSTSFNSLPNNIIKNFLVAKGIRKVILSYGDKTEYQKMKEFVAHYSDVFTIEILVGANEWIYPENHDRAVARTLAAAEMTNRVHLDIEPHALDLYDKNKDEYLNLYLALIEKINNALGEDRLTVSVPAIWSDEIYTLLEKTSDDIVIMLYGNKSSQKLVEKILRFNRLIPAERLVVSLKTAEFNDENDLENTISYIRKNTDIEKFAIYNFRDFYSTAGITQ